jgi:hypothetical protein
VPSEYQQHLARIRDQNCRREEVFRARYQLGTSKALSLAQRWRLALISEPLDWNELSSVRDEARSQRPASDVALFGFINQLEQDYELLRKSDLENR